MDDQAETILVNLLRGAGADGLAGMAPGARHPILGLRRSETHALCAAAGLGPVCDESNDDPAFVRNRVRHELLPLCAQVAGPRSRPAPGPPGRRAARRGGPARHRWPTELLPDPADARAVAAAPRPLARRGPAALAARERVMASTRRRWPRSIARWPSPPGAAVGTELSGGPAGAPDRRPAPGRAGAALR